MGVSLEGASERRLVGVDIGLGEALEVLEADARVDGHEAPVRRDDQRAPAHPRRTGRRTRKGLGVRELAAEVETAHEGEDIADGAPFARSQGRRDGEDRALPEEQLPAPSVEPRRGKEEDAGHGPAC